MYRSNYFSIQEYVPPRVYAQRGERAWQLLDDRLLRSDHALRKKFGAIIINNWHSQHLIERVQEVYTNWGVSWNPVREWSGLRTVDSPYYSEFSQHPFGRASDKIFLDVTVAEVREYILKHQDEFPLIMSLELDTKWLHHDVRNCDRILTYKPKP